MRRFRTLTSPVQHRATFRARTSHTCTGYVKQSSSTVSASCDRCVRRTFEGMHPICRQLPAHQRLEGYLRQQQPADRSPQFVVTGFRLRPGICDAAPLAGTSSRYSPQMSWSKTRRTLHVSSARQDHLLGRMLDDSAQNALDAHADHGCDKLANEQSFCKAICDLSRGR